MFLLRSDDSVNLFWHDILLPLAFVKIFHVKIEKRNIIWPFLQNFKERLYLLVHNVRLGEINLIFLLVSHLTDAVRRDQFHLLHLDMFKNVHTLVWLFISRLILKHLARHLIEELDLVCIVWVNYYSFLQVVNKIFVTWFKVNLSNLHLKVVAMNILKDKNCGIYKQNLLNVPFKDLSQFNVI